MKDNRFKKSEELGSVIKRRRKSLKLTQKQLAEFAGCGVAYIYMLEMGKPTIRIDKLLDVLRILGLGLRVEENKEGLKIDERLK